MRVLFITWSWSSHYYPMVPFGWALRAAGHEVMVASQPSFASTITRAGLPALPVGGDIDVRGLLRAAHRRGTEDQPPVADGGRIVVQTAADCAEAMADDTIGFSRAWQPDFVVYEPLGFLGPVLADALEVPSLRLLWATDSARRILRVEDELLGGLARHIGATRVNLLGDVTLDPCPPELQVAADITRQPMRYIPYNGPAQLPPTLRTPPARPRVIVTWGGSLYDLGWHDGILAPRVVQALARHPVEVILAIHPEQRHLFGDLPPNVIHAGPVALHLILPTAAAIIHQGGAGTTMTAMTHSTPQLIIPSAVDAVVNARQIEKTGAGHHLTLADRDPAALRDHVDDFLTTLPDYQHAATRLRQRHLTLPTPADVTTTLTHQLGCATGPWATARQAQP